MKTTEKFRKEFYSEIKMIPYLKIMESIKSCLDQCIADNKSAAPDCIVLHFSVDDRRLRKKYEEFFIEELVSDIRFYQQTIWLDGKNYKIRVELQTDARLPAGTLKIVCKAGEKILKTILKEKMSPVYSGKTQEWNAVDILSNEPKSGKCIMVVDDEPVLCAVLQKMLSRLDYNVLTANDGFEALKIFSYMDVDMVITDLRMPKMDGWELMKKVKQIKPDIPVILITGYHSMYSQTVTEDRMADGFISKPFSFNQIKDQVEALLKKQADSKSSFTHKF